MTSRQVPAALYQEVLDLVTRIAQPHAEPIENVDEAIAADALVKLEALFKRHESAGTSDPFLTETLADFTDDDAEAIRLYRLALTQSEQFVDEPTHTKKLGLAGRLFAAGFPLEAREQLAAAHAEAIALGDQDVIEEASGMAREFAV